MHRLLIFVLTLTTAFTFAQAPADQFTIVALPDTQIYAKSYPEIFASQTQWIADHVQDQNIKLVVGLGDIVDAGGNLVQWQTAVSAYSVLQGKVPYMVTIGNHDYDQNNPAGRTGATKNFNANFGPQYYANSPWYQGSYPAGSNENFYSVVNMNGTNYLVLMLEFDARDVALNWASGVMAAHPTMEAIVVTHSFTYSDNTRLSRCDPNSAGSFGISQDNDGEDMWWKFVRKYPNIRMVLSGHVVQGDGTGRRADLGDKGNLVNQILADYQSFPLGGAGYLRIIKITPSLNQVQVTTYSPYLDAYKTDANNQFTVPYKTTGMPMAGTVTGVVKNASTCALMPNFAITAGGQTVTTNANGAFTLPAAATQSYSLGVARQGWISESKSATATPVDPSPAKIFTATGGRVGGWIRTTAGVPISGATVTFSGGALRITKSVKDNSLGNYSSNWIPVGKYSMTISASGHVTQKTSVTLTTGITSTLNITLQ
ncbi:MAG: carboxypeptidase regulatory-like domain-containing protein [Terriglobales bacterium]